MRHPKIPPFAVPIAAALVCLAFVQQPEFPVLGGQPPGHPPETYVPEVDGFETTIFVDGLDIPWSLVFAPDGRMFISERPGTIRVGENGRLAAEPFGTIEVNAEGEGGLMGLAVAPDFADNPWLYVMYTYRRGSGDTSQIVNRVSRFRAPAGSLGAEEILIDGILGGRAHDGGRIAFGPDGKLYVGTGEAFQKERAQDMDDLGGKILRIEPDGSIPADNPFPGSPIYTLGHRNVQGLAWHPQTGALFNSEHGPSGERWTRADGEQVRARAHDEVNVMTAGGNAGWANIVGYGGVEGYIDPILVWPGPAVPPSGMTFYTGELMPELAGDLFLATLAAEALFRIQFDDPGNPHDPTSVERWFSSEEGRGTFGRLRDVVQGPDGALYLLTNSDRRRRGEGRGRGRGVTRPEGLDKVLRIAPTGR